ncbi:unnamed protein product [Clavelina lepadiformis]|uniref:Uncharacterized protein n=1 Tax=Clavelina lepadiformis TaxID=159417 RepID=A0ABP0G902_CLALP
MNLCKSNKAFCDAYDFLLFYLVLPQNNLNTAKNASFVMNRYQGRTSVWTQIKKVSHHLILAQHIIQRNQPTADKERRKVPAKKRSLHRTPMIKNPIGKTVAAKLTRNMWAVLSFSVTIKALSSYASLRETVVSQVGFKVLGFFNVTFFVVLLPIVIVLPTLSAFNKSGFNSSQRTVGKIQSETKSTA